MGIKEAIQRQAAEERENIHDFSFREAKKEPIFFDPKEELGDFEWQEIERFLFTNAPGELLNIAKLLKAYKTILQDDFELAKVPKQFIDRIKAIVEVDRLRQQQIEFPISTVWRLLEEHLEIIDFLSATERARILNHDIEEECSEDLKKEIERGKDKANLSWAMGMARNCRTSRRAFPRLVEKIDKDVVQRVIQEINEEIKSKKGKGVTEVIRLCDLIADFRQAFPEKIKKIILSDETKEWMIREWRKFKDRRRQEGFHSSIYGAAAFAEWTANLMIVTALEIKVSLEGVKVIGRKENFAEEKRPRPIRLSFGIASSPAKGGSSQ